MTAALPLHDATDPLRVPRGEAEAQAAAAALGMTIPDACLPGVVANLALIDGHAAIFRAGRDGRAA